MLRRFGALLLLSFLCLSARAPQESLEEMSSSIRGRLTDLKAQSASMTALCETLQSRLERSRKEVEEWKATSTRLSSSLESINEQLSDCYLTIEQYKTRLKSLRRLNAALFGILAVRLALMVCGYILYARGVVLPRWLDILL